MPGLVDATGQPIGGLKVKDFDGSTRVVPRIGRNGLPECPWEIQEEVERYARQHGRHGKVHFVPNGGWFVRFTLRSNDKRMQLYQQGMAAEPPSEDVWFHLPKPGGRPGEWEPLDICQLGPSGVREFLEKGNTWSGRGQYRSIEEAARSAREQNARERERFRQEKKNQALDRVKDRRRSILKIPFHRVGIDLGGKDDTGE